MSTVTLGVSTRSEINRRFLAAMEGKEQGEFISFESTTQLLKILTAKRIDIINCMVGRGPMTIRELSRRLDRDVKGVHRDVSALLDVGIIQRTEQGEIIFPYSAVHVDFMLEVA